MKRRASMLLVLGGAGSGKTAHALKWAGERGERRIYLATARLLDAETARKAEAHRRERGPGWTTVEEPLDPAGALEAWIGKADVLVLDCLGMWTTNLLCAGQSPDEVVDRARDLARTLAALDASVAVVGNETGLGLVPASPLGRDFQNATGRMNRLMAETADQVVFMVAGLPMGLKG